MSSEDDDGYSHDSVNQPLKNDFNQLAGDEDYQTLDKVEIKDRYHLVQMTMLLLGTCTLLPWNFLITANQYWFYKFRKVGEQIDLNDKSKLQSTFESYLGVSSTVSLTVFLFLTTFFGQRFRQDLRVLISLGFIILLLIITTIFVKVNSDSWQAAFLVITLVTAIFINGGLAIFQSAIGGIASMLPSNCMNAFMNGQALGGVFAAVASILTLIDPNVSATNSALAFFLVAIVFSICTLVAYYFLMTKSSFYRYYVKRNDVGHHTVLSLSGIYTIFKKIWPYAVSAWFILASTLSLFPGVIVNSVSSNSYAKTIWTGKLFIPIVIFLLYNISDFCGRYVSLWLNYPKRGNPLLYVLSFLRVIISVLLLFCNRNPRHDLPTWFPQDYSLIILMVCLGLSNGYLLTLAMMYAPMSVSKDEQEMVGTIMVTFAGMGIMSGTLISLVLVDTV